MDDQPDDPMDIDDVLTAVAEWVDATYSWKHLGDDDARYAHQLIDEAYDKLATARHIIKEMDL